MYADTGLGFRFMQGCSPEIHQFEDLFKPYKLSDQTVCLNAFDFVFVFVLPCKGWVFLGRCKDRNFNLSSVDALWKELNFILPFDLGFVIMGRSEPFLSLYTLDLELLERVMSLHDW